VPRPRISIAALMAVVALIGLGFASLRNANAWWASAAFTTAVVANASATVGAVLRRDRSRALCVGFAVFGWTAMLIWLTTGPASPFQGGFRFGAFGFGHFEHIPGKRDMFGGISFGGSPDAVRMVGDAGVPMPNLLPRQGLWALVPGLSPPPAAGTEQVVAYVQISQSLEMLLFGLAGAFISRLVAPKDNRCDTRETGYSHALSAAVG